MKKKLSFVKTSLKLLKIEELKLYTIKFKFLLRYSKSKRTKEVQRWIVDIRKGYYVETFTYVNNLNVRINEITILTTIHHII